MKKCVPLLSLIFLCFGLSGCDDEFGCLNLYAQWEIYIPNGQTKAVYYESEANDIVLKKEIHDDKNHDLFVLPCSEHLATRRKYSNEKKVRIEYKSGKIEYINAKIILPYLEDNEQTEKEFKYYSAECNEDIRYVFSFYFFRTI